MLDTVLGLYMYLSYFNLHSASVRRLIFFTFCKRGPRVMEVTFASHLAEFLHSSSVQAEFGPDLLGDKTVCFSTIPMGPSSWSFHSEDAWFP